MSEIRKHYSGEVEIRASENGKDKILEGYAALYNSKSARGNLPFREVLAPGCFDAVLATDPDVRMLVNHDRNQMLGRTASGTLDLVADKKGLRFRCVLPDTQLARDTHALVKRGDMSGCSFAFSTDDDAWMKDAVTGEDVRTINNVCGLFDTSVVTDPVYEDTSVAARGTKPGNDDAAWLEKAWMRARLAAVEL